MSDKSVSKFKNSVQYTGHRLVDNTILSVTLKCVATVDFLRPLGLTKSHFIPACTHCSLLIIINSVFYHYHLVFHSSNFPCQV